MQTPISSGGSGALQKTRFTKTTQDITPSNSNAMKQLKHTSIHKNLGPDKNSISKSSLFHLWKLGTVNIRTGKEKSEGAKMYAITKEVARAC